MGADEALSARELWIPASVDGVDESLVVHLEDPDGEGPGSVVLLVVLTPQQSLDDELTRTIRARLPSELSPRHVPDEIFAARLAVPKRRRAGLLCTIGNVSQGWGV